MLKPAQCANSDSQGPSESLNTTARPRRPRHSRNRRNCRGRGRPSRSDMLLSLRHDNRLRDHGLRLTLCDLLFLFYIFGGGAAREAPQLAELVWLGVDEMDL